MSDDGNGFTEYKLLILDALKRHEETAEKYQVANSNTHKEIMAKLNKLEVIVTANEREMKVRQGIWGALGGGLIVLFEILREKILSGGP